VAYLELMPEAYRSKVTVARKPLGFNRQKALFYAAFGDSQGVSLGGRQFWPSVSFELEAAAHRWPGLFDLTHQRQPRLLLLESSLVVAVENGEAVARKV